MGADPLKLVAFAQGVGDCRRCTAQPGVENTTRNRATVLFRSFVANFDVAGTDMGETRRALAFGMRELPPFDGGVNSSSWGFDLQYLIEDEDNADVREALMITYAQTGKHPYRVKESYLRGLWTAAKSPEEKARVANAMISIYTEDYIRDSKESSLRALRALRAFNVSPALRKHIKSVLDSNHHQPTARAGFPNGSTRYN